jgi:hypothetical protein
MKNSFSASKFYNIIIAGIITIFLVECTPPKKVVVSNPNNNSYAVDSLRNALDAMVRDSDGDGVPDSRDLEPMTVQNARVGSSGVAIDSDNDGYADWKDSEPLTMTGSAVSDNGVALDKDNDKVPDFLDLEMNTPAGNIVDTRGRSVILMAEAELKNNSLSKLAIQNAALKSQMQSEHGKLILIDSTLKIENDILSLQSAIANIAFHCDTEMVEGKPEYVYAVLGSDLLKRDDVLEYVVKYVNKTRQDEGKAPVSRETLKTDTIQLGEFIKIELLDPANNFTITPLTNSERKVEKSKPMLWRWVVTPNKNTGGKDGSLKIEISSVDKIGDSYAFPPRSYTIRIRFREKYFVELWRTVIADPQWPITAIVFPVIAFFAGMWKERKSKTKAEG